MRRVLLVATLALGCRRTPPDLDRSAIVGNWVYVETDPDHEGLTRGRRELDLLADGRCADRFVTEASPNAGWTNGTWRVDGNHLVFAGCMPATGEAVVEIRGGDLTFLGNEGTFIFRRR
jgi:hypothetical protein